MKTTIENICYEYADDVLVSQDLNKSGNPKKVIVYVQEKFLNELSKFLNNHDYQSTQKRIMGKHFVLITFCSPSQKFIRKREA
tara:strand:+ start:155 stop:403 length:249 start_codon:yes stop_codon:yes gene_type:complete